MSIDIGSVFEDGIDAFLSKKAAVLVGVFLAFAVANSIAGDTFGLVMVDTVLSALTEQGAQLPPDALAQLEQQRREFGWALEVGLGPAIALLVGVFVVGEVVRIGAVRALADDTTNDLESRHYLDNFAAIFLHRMLAAIITFALLAVSAVLLLLIPGTIFPPLVFLTLVPFFYIAIGLYFASYAVTIDEVGALEGVARGWQYAKGNRIKLALIAVGVFVVQFVIGIPSLLFVDFGAVGGGLETTIQRTPSALALTAIVGAVGTVFQIAVAAQTYVHLGNADVPPRGLDGTETDQFSGDTQF